IISDGFQNEINGKVKRINRKVDESTQTVKLFLEFKNVKLFEGKFVEVKIPLGVIAESQLINRSLLINDSYVYVANENKFSFSLDDLGNCEIGFSTENLSK
ncbi:MAG: hypothetical protein CMC17_01130, partial [Flavobacteriaceae bacterium]|nr:hypothetical protein [Flavobacteriaceae bacterium]